MLDVLQSLNMTLKMDKMPKRNATVTRYQHESFFLMHTVLYCTHPFLENTWYRVSVLEYCSDQSTGKIKTKKCNKLKYDQQISTFSKRVSSIRHP